MRTSSSPRPASGGWALTVLGCAALLAGCAPGPDREHGARLLHVGDLLEPTTTFEVRFDEPAIEEDRVGSTEQPSPLRFAPELRGEWTWLSRRSGVFRPAEAPALDQVYRVSLARGRAHLARTLRTPEFGFEADRRPDARLDNASCTPRVVLRFNEDVLAAAVAGHCVFESAGGQRVPALVQQGTRAEVNDAFLSPWASGLSWRQRFTPPPPARGATTAEVEEVEPEAEVLDHVLVIQPAHPLPTGSDWQLRVRAGLPSARAGLRLRREARVPMGQVIPFAATNVVAHGGLEGNRRLELQFSKRLSPELTRTSVLAWVEVSPAPAGLAASVGDQTLSLAGAFLLDQPYQVTVKAGLPAREPVTQAGDFRRQVTFSPLPSRLRFPATSTEQLSEGARTFELWSVNVPQVMVRARRLDRHTLIHALRGYQSYFRSATWMGWEEPGEPYRPLDFHGVPGLRLPERTLTLSAARDEPVLTVLDWDDLLAGRRHAAVFLEASAGPGAIRSGLRPGVQALVQLTDLGLYWKRTETEVWAMAFSYRTGQPVPEAALRLVTEDGEVLAEATAGAGGLAALPWRAPAAWLMAEHGEDIRAAEVRRHGLYVEAADIPRRYDWSGPEPDRRVLFFSERPVYRPGDPLHLKAVVRDWDGEADWRIPAGLTGHLTLHDARDHRFQETNVTFSALGSWSGTVRLPTAGRGTYRAVLRLGTNEFHRLYFQVQDYQPDAFAIALPLPPAFAAGEPITVPVSARHWFGDPVRGGTVRWTVRAEDEGFQAPGLEAFAFGVQVWYPGLPYGALSWSAQGRTNHAQPAPLTLTCPVPLNPHAPQPRRVELQIEWTDLNQQTLAQSARTLVHSSDFYLGVRLEATAPRAGQPWPVQIVAVRSDGQPLTEAITARLRLQQIEWRTVRQQGAGGSLTYRSEPELLPVFEGEVPTQPLEPADQDRKASLAAAAGLRDHEPESGRPEADTAVAWQVPADAPPAALLTAPAAGTYLLEARAQDAAGREVLTALTVYVSGRDTLAWDDRSPARLELVPDRPAYGPGDTATVLVKAPFAGTAVVTLERERVMRSFVTNLTGNAPALAVPLHVEDAPAVFLSVMLLRGLTESPRTRPEPEHALGYCTLEVRRPEQQLDVTVQLASPEVRPAQSVAVTVTVQDGHGVPAAAAEVTLFAVDEGVLSLTDYQPPDPHAFFHGVRPLAVWPHGTLPDVLPEDPEFRRFQNKGYLVGGGGKSGERLRRDFPACAFWNATLTTDDAGRVAVEFPAPDALTEFRVLAVVHTARHQFGSGTARFRVNQPLQLEPALPAFAHRGDLLHARAVLHNRTEHEGRIEVSLDLDEQAVFAPPDTLPAPSPQQVRVPARAAVPLEFPVRFQRAGMTRWIWRARWLAPDGESFQDAVESTLPIHDPAPWLREIHLTRSRTPVTNLLERADPQLLEAATERQVTVRLANTRLGDLGDALEHLLQYPYGCAEQTLSSLLPWLALADFPDHLPVLATRRHESRAAIEQGLHRLLTMQTSDGGIAYWPGGRTSMPWLSAYAELALVLAGQQGWSYPAEARERLQRHLQDSLALPPGTPEPAALAERALALWVLTLGGRPAPGHADTLFAHRQRMTPESRAWLALGLPPGTSQDRVLPLLEPPREPLPAEDHWFGGPARELAVQLLARCRLQPEHPEVDRSLEALLALRQGGHWQTTQGNAWALLALAEYARQIEGSPEATTGAVAWGSDRRDFSMPATPHVLEILFPALPGDPATPLRLENPQARRLFVQTTLAGRRSGPPPPAQDRGFALQRRYDRVDDDGALLAFAGAQVGDRVLVTLSVEVRRPAYFVAVEDPLPSLLEPVLPEFVSRRAAAGADLASDWVSDFRELRADRALFFCNRLSPGRHTLRYLARVRAAGTALAPGAKIEEMYQPERFGLSEAQTVQATAANPPGDARRGAAAIGSVKSED